MLNETHREPMYPGYGSTEGMQTRTQLRGVVRKSFFTRSYSTVARQLPDRQLPTSLLTFRAELINRRVDHDDSISALAAYNGQQQIKP